MAKHVIFLGAGASKSSGYPLANELRLLMSSREHFEEAVIAGYAIQKKGASTPPYLGNALKYFDDLKDSIDLFRYGAYATMDEFCHLAIGSGYDSQMNNMRMLCRLVLGLHNPEANFHESEYYPFAQRLFMGNRPELRDDVVVVTFNYDPYLEFLLMRAYSQRAKVLRRNAETNMLNALSSGLYDYKDANWLNTVGGFSLLKLHGSISYPHEQVWNHDVFFTRKPDERMEPMMYKGGREYPPAIVFPWEIFDEKGNFIPEEDFIDKDPHFYPLFKGIWERARHEIKHAEKVSFVGMSMHHFLQPAFDFLFANKGRNFSIVVANPGNNDFLGKPVIEHLPQSPARKIGEAIKKSAINMFHGGYDILDQKSWYESIKALSSFKEFIEKEM